MKKIRRLATIITLSAMATVSSQDVEAQEYCTSSGGCAYESAYQSCCLAPAIGLALAGLAVIIAVGVHNRSSHSHNSH